MRARRVGRKAVQKGQAGVPGLVRFHGDRRRATCQAKARPIARGHDPVRHPAHQEEDHGPSRMPPTPRRWPLGTLCRAHALFLLQLFDEIGDPLAVLNSQRGSTHHLLVHQVRRWCSSDSARTVGNYDSKECRSGGRNGLRHPHRTWQYLAGRLFCRAESSGQGRC